MATKFLVTPMSQRISLVPGETTEGSIRVINPSDATSDFKYKVEILPYSMTEDGEIDSETEGPYSQIVKWISVPEETGTVVPNESKEVKFTISVPVDAPGGAQSAAIVIVPDDAVEGEGGMKVMNSFPIASVVYATVAGETRHDTKIIGSELPNFALSSPVYATVQLANDGNTYETAEVTLTATNLITGEVILGDGTEGAENGNVYSEMVMPDNTRTVVRAIDGLPVAGVVKLEQTVEYGGESSTISSNLVIFPVWLMVVMMFLTVMVVGVIVGVVRHLRRKKAEARL